MSEDAPRLLVVGAHPDDAELKAGGLAALYRNAGRDVTFVSLTDGGAGHHRLGRTDIAERRRREAVHAADVVGADVDVWDYEDGALTTDVSIRTRLIRLIRRVDPALVLTHRPYDYHPDHRATARIVADTAYLVTVPNVCPETPALATDPVYGYVPDEFQDPTPFEPDVVVDVDDVVEEKVEMCHRHASQMYEWLPSREGVLEEVPDGDEPRKRWLREFRGAEFTGVAERFREQLRARYGTARGDSVEHAEAVEVSAFGHPLTAERREALFPW
jgi:LmbE family N-acetylglucosaminyl deacetylase